MATTLGEILSAKGDADYADGGFGGAINPELYSTAAANQYLQHAADLTYQAHRYLADQHDRNMQETLKGLNDVDFKNLLPQDSHALMGQYTGVLQDTANNFGVIRNPLSNPSQYAALKSNESGFRQKLSQAQQDAAFIQKQNEFVQTHPEYNTPDFKNKVAKFMATPVGQREYFTVAPPLTYNPATAYKTVNELSKQKYAQAGSNGKYITQEEGEKIDPNKYLQLAKRLPGTDQYGNSLEDARRNAYESLPPSLKSQYKNYDDFVDKEAKLYMMPDQVNKKDIKADEYGTIDANYRRQLSLQNDRQAFDANQKELDRNNALVIAGLREGKVDQQAAAEGNLRTVASVMRTGTIPAEIGQKLYGDNHQIETKIGSPTDDAGQKTIKAPALEFVNSGIDKNGNIHIYMRDNKTGKMLQNAKVVSYSELLNDLNNSYGVHSPAIQGEISKFSEKNFGKKTPSVIDLLNHFGLGTDVKPTTRDKPAAGSKYNAPLPDKVTFPDSPESSTENTPSASTYVGPNGQELSMDALKKSYSEEQIQNYIKAGILKAK